MHRLQTMLDSCGCGKLRVKPIYGTREEYDFEKGKYVTIRETVDEYVNCRTGTSEHGLFVYGKGVFSVSIPRKLAIIIRRRHGFETLREADEAIELLIPTDKMTMKLARELYLREKRQLTPEQREKLLKQAAPYLYKKKDAVLAGDKAV